MAGRYAHAEPFGGMSGSCASSAAGLWPDLRDVTGGSRATSIIGGVHLPLGQATRIRWQQQRPSAASSFIASYPEVECIGKGGPRLQLRVKATLVTNNHRRAPGHLLVLHAGALPDNRRRSRLQGIAAKGRSPAVRSSRYVDENFAAMKNKIPHHSSFYQPEARHLRRHQAPLRHHSAIEPIIGHLKAEGHLRTATL